MKRKIVWIILFSILGLAIAILGGSYYLRSSGKDTTLNNQQQGEKAFLSFSLQKKLSQTNEKVSLVAVGDIFYSRGVGRIVEKQEDSNYQFSKIQDHLKSADLDNNSIQENYALESGRLTITENANVIWQSPTDWWIDNFILADSNNDEVLDINLSVWKAGNFGASKPFWIEENDMSVKNHFFVFDFVDRTVKPIWQSSNLEAPNCEFIFADIDGDGKNDLVVIEGDYSQKPKCNGNYVAVWKWNGWGFSNEWRSGKGNFSNLKIEKTDGRSYITVDSY